MKIRRATRYDQFRRFRSKYSNWLFASAWPTPSTCKQAMKDIVVNDEKRLTFVAVHERVRRISGGHCKKTRGKVRIRGSRAVRFDF